MKENSLLFAQQCVMKAAKRIKANISLVEDSIMTLCVKYSIYAASLNTHWRLNLHWVWESLDSTTPSQYASAGRSRDHWQALSSYFRCVPSNRYCMRRGADLAGTLDGDSPHHIKLNRCNRDLGVITYLSCKQSLHISLFCEHLFQHIRVISW